MAKTFFAYAKITFSHEAAHSADEWTLLVKTGHIFFAFDWCIHIMF